MKNFQNTKKKNFLSYFMYNVNIKIVHMEVENFIVKNQLNSTEHLS